MWVGLYVILAVYSMSSDWRQRTPDEHTNSADRTVDNYQIMTDGGIKIQHTALKQSQRLEHSALEVFKNMHYKSTFYLLSQRLCSSAYGTI